MYYYGIDINVKSKSSNNGNTGWVRINKAGELTGQGFNIKELGEAIADNILAGEKVALGFEAPMWYPVPNADDDGSFQMTARFNEEEEAVFKYNKSGKVKKRKDNGKPVIEANKHWYIGGSQPMVKVNPIGLLLFEWLLKKYRIKCKNNIMVTTEFDIWRKCDKCLLYLYEGFVTGLYKPTKENFMKIKQNGALTNDEVADAFIMANAVRLFTQDLKAATILFPDNKYRMFWKKHLRICISQNTPIEVISSLTEPNHPPSTGTSQKYKPNNDDLKAPIRFISVWEHVITDANNSLSSNGKQAVIEFTGKKACDVYGFKFRENRKP